MVGGERDEAVIRQVSTHHELPTVQWRERSTAPVAFDQGPAQQANALTTDPTGSPGAPGGDDHLERRMKQILDEAARRHGIEV